MRGFLVTTFILSASICYAQYIQKVEALADIEEFIGLLEKQSSYYQISDFDFENHYKQLAQKISLSDSIPIHFLAFELEKTIAEIVDRHANIRIDSFEESDIELYNLYFPFALAPMKGKVVALKRNTTTQEYEYYLNEYPFLKSINEKDINNFLNHYAYRRKLSPKKARLKDGLRDLRDIGKLFFKQNELNKKEIQITLTDSTKDKNLTLPLSKTKHQWLDIGSSRFTELSQLMNKGEEFDYHRLHKWVSDSVAYINFPAMISYDDYGDFEAYLNTTIKKYRKAKAFIIDIRGNGGGRRHILKTLSNYIVQPEQSPWIANVTYVRDDEQLDKDISSMQGRFLYNYHSDFVSDEDRKAIDQFLKTFQLKHQFDKDKFSSPFYMILHSGESPLTCPIYIMVNEECFSAASVFASAFKGLPNVKIVGITTNGSSGRSRRFYLTNSNIRVKLSTMLSFQRNGETLDGNGTIPDIVIERNEDQILGKRDTQLERLLEEIQLTKKH